MQLSSSSLITVPGYVTWILLVSLSHLLSVNADDQAVRS